MKKKIVIALTVMVLIVLTVYLRNIGMDMLLVNVEYATVERGSFTQQYQTNATVTGHRHRYFFNGVLTSLKHYERDYVEENEVLLEYLDVENKKKELKSTVRGYVTAVDGNGAEVCDLDLFLECYLPSEKYRQVKEETVCLFKTGNMEVKATVSQRNGYGIKKNDRVYHRITLRLESADGMNLNEQGNLIIPLQSLNDVLTVDKRALLKNDEGYSLLMAEWIDDLNHTEKYRVKVNVEAINDSVAVVSGENLENMKVCIISDELKELLNDQT